jgi:hypothetical protein
LLTECLHDLCRILAALPLKVLARVKQTWSSDFA